jgi:hypothetical protein
MYSGKYGTFNCICTDYLVEVNDDGQRTLLPDENDQQSAWSVRMRKREVRMVATVGWLLCSLVDCTETGQHRNKDEEVNEDETC